VQPVVVDNGSHDGIAAAIEREFRDVERPPVCIAAERNLGFGRGNNLALRTFDAAYYFIANPDLVFLEDQAGTIGRLHAFMESAPYVGLVAPRLQLPDGATQPSCMRFPGFFDHPMYRTGLHRRFRWARARVDRLHMTDVDHTATRPVDWVTGAAMFVRGHALRAAGYFDERYFLYCEDCDLCRSCWATAWPVYYKGDIVVQHGHARSSAAVPGLKSILVNPLTRVHIRSLVQYTTKWWGTRV
jgi:GT2 family glycosyltransferase